MIDFIKDELAELKSETEEKEAALALLEDISCPDRNTLIQECMERYDELIAGMDVPCRKSLRTLLQEFGLIVVYDPDRKEVRLSFDPFACGQQMRKSA